ncbi:hypothetical protein BN000_02112 [Mycobacterium europaeum]|uniref:Uncharacterized protein n=1 Tax=Mycobacterium europaeum TaxID=761804 RepID=A0A0U1DA49_9MYCO|nr:hypothetical protein [Mycobacterium europaeum]CQD10286.1 hypothetical protein BN000_02112 [Mycobacterium europaeum]
MAGEYHVNLNDFPPALCRIVKSWYSWQEVYLRKMGSSLLQSEFSSGEHRGESAWGTKPPRMTDEKELCFIDDGELSYYLVIEDDKYYIDKKSRSSRERYWMFRRFEDAEKYMLFLLSQAARPGKYSDSPSFRWYREGLNPEVTLTKPDPVNFPGRVSLTVDHEPSDRGWMPEHDAIAASHLIVLSFEELDEALRQGIPRDWFNIKIVTS